MEKPIEVNEMVLPTTLAAALRYGVAILGTMAVSKGWVDADNVDGIATLLITATTVSYGLWKTHRRKKQLVVVAEAAPNSVAVVKGK